MTNTAQGPFADSAENQGGGSAAKQFPLRSVIYFYYGITPLEIREEGLSRPQELGFFLFKVSAFGEPGYQPNDQYYESRARYSAEHIRQQFPKIDEIPIQQLSTLINKAYKVGEEGRARQVMATWLATQEHAYGTHVTLQPLPDESIAQYRQQCAQQQIAPAALPAPRAERE
jgi:hypothetical protein